MRYGFPLKKMRCSPIGDMGDQGPYFVTRTYIFVCRGPVLLLFMITVQNVSFDMSHQLDSSKVRVFISSFYIAALHGGEHHRDNFTLLYRQKRIDRGSQYLHGLQVS